MQVVKRSKGGKTHYAAVVSPAGVVTKWVPDRAGAVPVGGAALDAVKAHYAAKAGDPNLGVIRFEDADPQPPSAPKPPEKPADPQPPSAPKK